ncbi:Anaerobic nitric oxide reductase flavorubredoxin [bioreactor metagenome]|uniref:Anaerobic nitric oxide reductase flavorubredoxin n=1 Tax=bioreactor metagenome TaxID=1076179 RepID=A0A644X969_9ZZZZ
MGKYGPHVQALLKKAGTIDIKIICPLHGPVWRSNLGYFLEKYDKWSRYEPEEKGVMIVYSSMYGNTEAAAGVLAARLAEKGMTNVWVYDVSSTHLSKLVSETFRLSHIVFAAVTYNLGLFPPMQSYLDDLKALRMRNRTVAIVENGSWACRSGSLIRDFMEHELKNITVLDEQVSLNSALHEENAPEMDTLAGSILASMK